MFERDLDLVAASIRQVLAEQGVPDPGEVKWQPTPFTGDWGQGTNVAFQAAAAEARATITELLATA